jgi:hypothetical protein
VYHLGLKNQLRWFRNLAPEKVSSLLLSAPSPAQDLPHGTAA